MNVKHLGDALDPWKGWIFEFLNRKRLLRNLVVDPMISDEERWDPYEAVLYARLLHISEAQILNHKNHLAARTVYFAEIPRRGDLFLDPDTGIWTSGSCSPVVRYVKPRELAVILKGRPRRVVVVYQHVSRRTPDARLSRCLEVLAGEVDGGWCAYKSPTAAMLFLSLDATRTEAIAEAFRGFLGRCAENRIGAGRIAAQ